MIWENGIALYLLEWHSVFVGRKQQAIDWAGCRASCRVPTAFPPMAYQHGAAGAALHRRKWRPFSPPPTPRPPFPNSASFWQSFLAGSRGPWHRA